MTIDWNDIPVATPLDKAVAKLKTLSKEELADAIRKVDEAIDSDPGAVGLKALNVLREVAVTTLGMVL